MHNHITHFLNLDVSFYIRMDYWHSLVAMTTCPSITLRIELSILFEFPKNLRGISSQSSSFNIHTDKVYSSVKTSVGLSVAIFQYLGRGKIQIQHTGFYGTWLKITDLWFCLEGQQNIFKVEAEKKFEELDYEGWRLRTAVSFKENRVPGHTNCINRWSATSIKL